jgi:SAM-dependent methyltransferase
MRIPYGRKRLRDNGMGSYSKKDVAYFNQFADGYMPYTPDDLVRMLEPLEKVIRPLHMAKVCEIGCASGQFSDALASQIGLENIRLYGIDIALKVLSTYKYEKVCGSAFALPFASESFDVVCLPATLHHLFPFEASLRELSRVLRPGGYLYCLEPNYHHPQRFFFMRFTTLYNLYRKANDVPINADVLRKMLYRFDLQVSEFEYININFNHPSFLQRAQNIFAKGVNLWGLKKFTLPWFILLARKMDGKK